MKDLYNREIDYLRISVTDRCNLKCLYCVPEDGIECVPADEVLSFDEIVMICEQAAALGIRKIKITGGEPLVRAGIPELVGMLHRIQGIEQVTMTTNGILLEKYMDELVANGLDAVNISIDSLDEDNYHRVTRVGNLEEALKGLEAAKKSGIRVKVNAVLYPGEDWKQIIELAKDSAIDVRFIETMPIGTGDKYSGAFKEDILKYFEEEGIKLTTNGDIRGNGPAVYFKPEGYQGYIGIISPIHGKFCDSCNRIRLSATGMVKPCLCYKERYDLKKCVKEGNREDIRETLRNAILAKPAAHRFLESEYVTETQCMAGIGG